MDDDDTTYRIIRFYQGDQPRETIVRGLTLEQAQDHCKDPQSSSRTTTTPEGLERTRLKGDWFDGYEAE